LKTFPKGSYVHAVQDEASLNQALQALLGADSLQNVSVFRSKVRRYIEWVSFREPKADRGGGSWSGPAPSYSRDMAFYEAVIMRELMNRLFRDMRNGEYHLATL